jgi:hypothetical protein
LRTVCGLDGLEERISAGHRLEAEGLVCRPGTDPAWLAARAESRFPRSALVVSGGQWRPLVDLLRPLCVQVHAPDMTRLRYASDWIRYEFQELRDHHTLRLGPILITTTSQLARDVGESRAWGDITGRIDERRRLLRY